MKKILLLGIAALLLATGTVHAVRAADWECSNSIHDGRDLGKISVKLQKNATKDFTLCIRGALTVNPIRVELNELPDGTVTLNGERCTLIDPNERDYGSPEYKDETCARELY
jgi:hypothetical protein